MRRLNEQMAGIRVDRLPNPGVGDIFYKGLEGKSARLWGPQLSAALSPRQLQAPRNKWVCI